jgi:membrane protease YdiL (CAAX protease family)
MFDNLIQRTAHHNWKTALFLFALMALVHTTAALLKSLPLNLFGMLLYAFIPLVFVRKQLWGEIGLNRPLRPVYILLGIPLAALFVLISALFLYFTVGFSSANYMAIVAKQQMSYGIVNESNAWQYFPIAVAGFCLFSPVPEELFFRGLILKALQSRFSAPIANTAQAALFGLIHLAYFGLVDFNMGLLLYIPFGLAGAYLFGWSVQKTGSVLSSIVLHGITDFIIILLVYAFAIPAIG